MSIPDYANQIANLLTQYLPYTPAPIGIKYIPESFSLVPGKITLSLSQEDYDTILAEMQDPVNPNFSFTVANINLKNRLQSFTAYPEGYFQYFGFTAQFKYPHKLNPGDEITFQDFIDPQYNTTFKVIRVISSFGVVLYPISTVNIQTVSLGLGWFPTTFTEGFNEIQTLIDEGGTTVSFEYDIDQYYVTNDENDLVLDILPTIYDYSENIKVIDAGVFLRNLVSGKPNESYILIDTSSLQGTPVRSKNNTTDVPYSAYSRNGRFDNNYTINLLYVLERNQDDIDNQTFSASDLVNVQTILKESLISITRQPLIGNNTKLISALTISADSVRTNILEGPKVIEYQMQFCVNYLDNIMINIDQKNSYPIKRVQVNTDVLNFS